MISSIEDCTLLNNGLKMPWLGFGVFKISDGQEVEQAVRYALEAGYRSIDTAAGYRNEDGVGKAIRESSIPREDLFLTTKLANEDQRKKRVFDAFEESPIRDHAKPGAKVYNDHMVVISTSVWHRF